MIGQVSESLKNLLEAEMSPASPVTLLSPADTSSQQSRVNLFLYWLRPHPQLRNQLPAIAPDDPGRLVTPPLVLNLYYLLTSYTPLDGQFGLADSQTIMAEAMRVLHEHPIVPQEHLEPGLRQGEVKVTLHCADVEELSKVWTALTKDFRLSAVYEVSYAPVPARGRTPVARPVETTRLGVEVTR
ncbi:MULTISPECIES: DUF4255 domain-containing protein [unclassified Streptosporangium]|uniref:DUF4255 domain-containing protein n=1 Tax=Streptosporangium sp. NPDC005286 TaxID=3154463 RepID=UPI0033B3ED66